MGKSSCSSEAPSSIMRSNTSLTTSCGRASLRSILLMTTMGSSPRPRALRRTKRVCGIAPSAASTRRMTPSTIDSTRSTSPPKSAWPGVSTMLIFTSLGWTKSAGRSWPDAVCVALMHRVTQGVRRVDEVADGGVLRQDGDAALFLQVVGVHDALVHLLVGAYGAGLLEERVDERGRAVVDVGDDGDVADVVTELLHARGLTQ